VVCIDDEIPFEIPKGWEWCRVRHVAEIARGGSPRPIKDFITTASNGVNWIKIGDTEKGGKYINATREKIKPEGVKHSRMVYKGDFLLTNSMSFGRPYILNTDGCIHDGWLVISPYSRTYHQDYLYYLLSSPFAFLQFSGVVSGAVVKNLNSNKVADSLFPMPPFHEQERIALRLKSIYPLIDSFSAIQDSKDELDFTIKSKLQKSILQEAIQGKLVPQAPNDEPTSVLLQRIKKEKQRLVKEGKLKKKDIVDSLIYKGDDNKYYQQIGKNLIDITDEIPFEIPDNWVWTRLSNVTNIYTGNSISETEKKAKYTNVLGRYYIGTKDVGFDNNVFYNNGIAIPRKYEQDFRIAPKDSILMCIEGGSAGRKIAMLNQDVCFGNKLCCFASFIEMGKYIYYYLQSPSFTDMFNQNKAGIIGGVSLAKVKGILIPLPPLKEQLHIINRLDELYSHL